MIFLGTYLASMSMNDIANDRHFDNKYELQFMCQIRLQQRLF